MFKKYKKIIFLFLLVLLAANVLAVTGVMAQNSKASIYDDIKADQLDPLKEIGLPGEPENPTDPVISIIRMIFGFLGLVFMILIIYAGVKWMTSGGNAEVIDKAKKIITSAVIGLIVIFLSYAITAFVFNVVLKS